jgi:hypothetical protein
VPSNLPLHRLYYGVRRGLALSGDRVGRWCDEQAVSVYRWRAQRLTEAAQAALLGAGSLAHVLKLMPRLEAALLRGNQWTAAWVGDAELSAELEHLLFPAGTSTQRLGRVAAWNLRQFASSQLAAVDLVVCALPRAWPPIWRPRGPVTFSCPVFVNLALDIRLPLDSLLRGRSKRGLRNDRNRSRREGYRWRLTTEERDLERFHREMYLPHVTRRHGPRALVTTMGDYRRNWTARGGSLLLLEQDGHPVAGVSVRVEGSTCVLGEEGILDTVEAAGHSQGIQAGLKCAAIEFAQSRGLTRFVMGRSLARLADPVLANKLRWDAAVCPSGRSLHPEWTFVMSRVGCPLSEHLNRQGLLTFFDGQPCVVALGSPADELRRAAEKIGRILIAEPGHDNRIESIRPLSDSRR